MRLNHMQNEFSKIPRIVYGFGNAIQPWPDLNRSMDDRFKLKLVHRNQIIHAKNMVTEFIEADGAWTDQKQILLAVSWADCVPILLARADGTKVAAIHAGWRGTAAKICYKMAENLTTKGESLSQWLALIGPSIRNCCYQVGAAVAQNFGIDAPTIDLATINLEQLKTMGFGTVEIDSPCTFCSENSANNKQFLSYRRDHTSARQWATIRMI
jgi:polyphenol oxidase